MRILDDNWESLAEMLRREIEGYGRLFHLLEEQRESLLKNNLSDLIETNCRMEAHTDDLDRLRKEREGLVSSLSRKLELLEGPPTVKRLLGQSPEDTQPLFEELLREVNRLIAESRRKLERNQMLLHRSRDIGQTFLNMLSPEPANGGLYARSGRSRRKSSGALIGQYQARA